MAANNIGINTDLTAAQKMMSCIQNGHFFLSILKEVKAEMDAMVNGNDFTKVENYYGLQVGQGAVLWYMLSTVINEQEGLAVTPQMLSWITPQK